MTKSCLSEERIVRMLREADRTSVVVNTPRMFGHQCVRSKRAIEVLVQLISVRGAPQFLRSE